MKIYSCLVEIYSRHFRLASSLQLCSLETYNQEHLLITYQERVNHDIGTAAAVVATPSCIPKIVAAIRRRHVFHFSC